MGSKSSHFKYGPGLLLDKAGTQLLNQSLIINGKV